MASHTLQRLLEHFPSCTCAFAYGSGVFPQPETGRTDEGNSSSLTSSESSRPSIDLIFSVPEPLAWHKQLLSSNPHRASYSALKHLGPHILSHIQNLPAGLYYNPSMTIEGIPIKYGVISDQFLIEDLKQWNFLYVAGRLQKPVKFLKFPSHHEEIKENLQKNLLSASAAALFLMKNQQGNIQGNSSIIQHSSPSSSLHSPPSPSPPHSFQSSPSFYHQLISLSYGGDIRMGIAENPRKIENILNGSYSALEQLYEKPLAILERKWHQERIKNPSISYSSFLYDFLPDSLHSSLPPRPWLFQQSLSIQQDYLSRELNRRVFYSSLCQTGKGIFTAGWKRSFSYVLRKIGKARGKR